MMSWGWVRVQGGVDLKLGVGCMCEIQNSKNKEREPGGKGIGETKFLKRKEPRKQSPKTYESGTRSREAGSAATRAGTGAWVP